MKLAPPANLLKPPPAQTPPPPVLEEHDEPIPPEQQQQPKKQRQGGLVGTAPPSLSALSAGPHTLDAYNLEALKKISKMAGVALPKPCTRAACIEVLTRALFAKECGQQEEEDEDVHTVNLQPRQEQMHAAAW